MKLTLTFSLILLHAGMHSLAQSDEKIEIRSLNRQLIKRKDTVYRFYAVLPEDPVRVYTDRTYYWFHSDTILATVGGYDGRLLDGSYTVFYPDKNLEEEGEFTYGLRTGEWRSWYPGGMIRNVVHWEKGWRTGPFLEFDQSGRKLREGEYRNDVLSGKVREYSSDGKYSIVEYKAGIAEEPPPPKKKKKKKAQNASEDEQ